MSDRPSDLLKHIQYLENVIDEQAREILQRDRRIAYLEARYRVAMGPIDKGEPEDLEAWYNDASKDLAAAAGVPV